MKRILILTTILVFACSSDDSSDSNNVSNEKLIESVFVFSADCAETENIWFNYENGIITSSQGQSYRSLCSSINTYPWDDVNYGELLTYSYEYLPNKLIISYNGGSDEILLNDDGTIDNSDYTFENGYLTSFQSECSTIINTWENGNLIQSSVNDCLDEDSNGIHTIEYTNYDAKLPFIPLGFNGNSFGFLNLQGKNSTKLPHKRISPRLNVFYTYTFDDEGYPTKITIKKEYNNNPNNDAPFDREVTFEITYTN